MEKQGQLNQTKATKIEGPCKDINFEEESLKGGTIKRKESPCKNTIFEEESLKRGIINRKEGPCKDISPERQSLEKGTPNEGQREGIKREDKSLNGATQKQTKNIEIDEISAKNKHTFEFEGAR